MTVALPGDQIWSELQPALAARYPHPPVVAAQAELGPDEGGPPLSKILAFAADAPSPHWLFVTCGLSAARFIPGYPDLGGVELSFRLARKPDEQQPPTWVPPFLQALGRDAFATPRPIQPEETVNLGPLWEAHDTTLTAGIYLPDPAGPEGPIRLLQLVALTAAERTRVVTSDAPAKLAFELWALGISDLARAPRPPPQQQAPRPVLPPRPPAPKLETVTVQKLDGRMRLSVSAAEAPLLAQALRDSIKAGSNPFVSGGWNVLLVVEDIPRSATWATTLAIYFTVDLAKQAAGELEDPRRHGRPMRWEKMPDLEFFVVGEAAATPEAAPDIAKPGFAARLKRFFGGS